LNRGVAGGEYPTKEVNLTKRVKISDGMRYCPVMLSANGRVKPDFIIVNREPERHSEGVYYLDLFSVA
jgi:hypothetical protein